MKSGDLAFFVESGHHLALGNGMILAVRHILLPRPDHFDGRTWHLFSNGDSLAHVIGSAAPPEATPIVFETLIRENGDWDWTYWSDLVFQ